MRMRAVAFFVLVLSLVSISHAWKCNEAPALYKTQQIDANQGRVLAVNYYKYGYFLNGRYWTNLHRYNLKHISSGPTGTWATDTKNVLYKLVGGNFTKVLGLSLTQVDAGGNGLLVGTYKNRAYCLRTSYADRYKGVGRVYGTVVSSYKFKHFSCGLNGCWGVDTIGRVYHARYVNAAKCSISGWRYISSGMSMVKVSSDGLAFGVSTSGEVYQRLGSSYGTSWSKIPMCMSMKYVSYDLGKLWVVSTSGLVMFCTH